jgi:hypothetical protein
MTLSQIESLVLGRVIGLLEIVPPTHNNYRGNREGKGKDWHLS